MQMIVLSLSMDLNVQMFSLISGLTPLFYFTVFTFSLEWLGYIMFP